MEKSKKSPHAIRGLNDDTWRKFRELCLKAGISANEGSKRLIHKAVKGGKLPDKITDPER